jgi:Xaa-Pro aminopeptidase
MTKSEHGSPTTIYSTATINRRNDTDRKQALIAQLLKDSHCEALLILHPANYRWFTGGSYPQAVMTPEERPVIFANPQNRWLICSNVDSQRLFDEELDLLGFQLKEVHWKQSRDAHLSDMVTARRIASDIDFRGCTNVGSYLEQERRRLSSYEVTLYRELGKILIHALEATLRNMNPGDTEEEIAGQLAHRLWKHGAEPQAIQISADGRAKIYRRCAVKSRPVLRDCQLQATASMNGLFVTASRTACFGPPEEQLRKEFEIATRMSTIYAAAIKKGDLIAKGIQLGREFPQNLPAQHEWRLSPPGFLTGREPAEVLLSLTSQERLQENVPVVFQARIGMAGVCDTFIFTEEGWKLITDVETWPVRSIIIDKTNWKRPEILVRK